MRAARLLVVLSLIVSACDTGAPPEGTAIGPSRTTAVSTAATNAPAGGQTTAEQPSAGSADTDPGARFEPAPPAVRVLLLGDLSLGRGVEPLAERGEALAAVRALLADADLTAANLESPLTDRPPVRDGFRLAASPGVGAELTRAGIDVAGVANNHAAESGSDGLRDTLSTLDQLGVAAVGVRQPGGDAVPVVLAGAGVRVAFLAFDVTGQGDTAGTPTVSTWDEGVARRAVERARAEADVVVVGLHGGIEGSETSDPTLRRLGEQLGSWGADVVWGHGSHRAQPVMVTDLDGDRRPTLLATSLGNAAFDQGPGSDGLALEVLLAADGVVAYRTGGLTQPAARTRFGGWDEPRGDAVYLARDWWTLVGSRRQVPIRRDPAAAARFTGGDVADAVVGDVDENGDDELVVAFRRPGRATPAQAVDPDWQWFDAEGRSAHLGRFRLPDLQPIWSASTLARPVRAVAACDGSIAVGYDPTGSIRPGAGAWRWERFGFRPATDLEGPGTPACVDVDGDGRTEPAVLDRVSNGGPP